jgi:hypothetical protein
VARTSHTGGHRYAPTALVVPEGTGWAFVDAAILRRIVRREGPIADVLPHYRGYAGLGGAPAAQAVEREVLREVGWGLFDLPRTGEDLGDGRARVQVEGVGAWEGNVSTGRSLPMPECGGPADVAVATARELTVGDVRRLA